MEIEQGSVVQADATMDGSIDSSSHKSKKQKIEEDLEEDPDCYYDSTDSEKQEEEDKEEETEHLGEKEKEDDYEEYDKFMLYQIHNADRYPEAYSHLLYMCNLALQDYNKKWSTGFVFSGIKGGKLMFIQSLYYQLTFTATLGVTNQTFLAKLRYHPFEGTITVSSCDMKILDDDKILGEQEEEPSHKSNEIMGEQEEKISDPVQRIKSLMGCSNDELLGKIKNHCDPDEDHYMLLKQVRKYFQSVIESQGFTIRYFPGHIPGVSDFKPRDKIIFNMKRHGVDGYARLAIMAKLAVDHYSEDKDIEDKYMVSRVINANVWKESSRSYLYYITFRGEKDYRYFSFLERMAIPAISFEAKVRDKQLDMDVLFCRKLVRHGCS